MNILALVKSLSLLAFLNNVLLCLLNSSCCYFSRVCVWTLPLSNRVDLVLSVILSSLKALLIGDFLGSYLSNILILLQLDYFSISCRVIFRVLYYYIKILVALPSEKDGIDLIGNACKEPLRGIE